MKARTLIWIPIAALGCGEGATDPEKSADCDPAAEGVQTERELWADADGDGYTAAVGEVLCVGSETPDGYLDAATETDCDDSSAGAYPGAIDFEDDGVDQDCDGADAVAEETGDIYVDVNDGDCQDDEAGTKEAPNCALEAAAAFAEEGNTLRVAVGEYDALAAEKAFDMVGGYDPATWTRESGSRSTILEPAPADGMAGSSVLTLQFVTADTPPVWEGFHLVGYPESAFSVGVDVMEASLVLRDMLVEPGGQDAGFALASVGLMLTSGNLTVEDSEIHGGGSSDTWCAAVHVYDGNLEVSDSWLGGCELAQEGQALRATGGNVIVADSRLEPAGLGNLTGALAYGTAEVFLTGVELVPQGSASTAVWVDNADSTGTAMLAVKNSALLPAASTGDSVAARVSEGGTLMMANSLLDAGASDEGDSMGLVVDHGTCTVVNSIFRVNASGDAGVSANVSTGELATLSLVSNDFFGLDHDSLLVGPLISVGDVEALDECEWTGCNESRLNTQADPEFEDLDSGSYRLATTSPLIDRGIDPSPYGLVVERDIEGNPAPSDGDGDSVAMWDVGPAEQ